MSKQHENIQSNIMNTTHNFIFHFSRTKSIKKIKAFATLFRKNMLTKMCVFKCKTLV